MKTIHCYTDLHQFGIRFLTGEACRVVGSGRVLCDLTAEGRKILSDLLGVPQAGFTGNWNSGAVASFMMPPGLFDDLAAWCLLLSGCHRVVIASGRKHDSAFSPEGIYGLQRGDRQQDWDDFMDRVKKFCTHIRSLRINDSLPGAGSRCEHQMSGRIA